MLRDAGSVPYCPTIAARMNRTEPTIYGIGTYRDWFRLEMMIPPAYGANGAGSQSDTE